MSFIKNTNLSIIIPIIVSGLLMLQSTAFSQQLYTLQQNDGTTEQAPVKEITLKFDNNGRLIQTRRGIEKSVLFSSVKLICFAAKINNAPIANAGADQTVTEGATVTLDGSLSFDPDQDNLTYKWSAPPGILLSADNVQKPILIAPAVKNDSILTFNLVVNDGLADSSPTIVTITVKNVLNVGVFKFSETGLKVYPNPTTGEVFVEFSKPVIAPYEITLFNADGQVAVGKFVIIQNKAYLDLRQMANGHYYIKINCDNYSGVFKILKND